MRYAAIAIPLLLTLACGESEPWDGQIVSSSVLSILKPGSPPPSGCAEAGRFTVPGREVGLGGRFSGAAIETFSQAVSDRVAELDANAIVPDGEIGYLDAAQSGEEFAATAYRCPE